MARGYFAPKAKYTPAFLNWTAARRRRRGPDCRVFIGSTRPLSGERESHDSKSCACGTDKLGMTSSCFHRARLILPFLIGRFQVGFMRAKLISVSKSSRNQKKKKKKKKKETRET